MLERNYRDLTRKYYQVIANSTNRYKILLFLLCVLSPLKGFSQSAQDAVNALVKSGFENVGWSENENERTYVLENIAYRLNGIGIGKAVDIIQALGLPQEKPCRIIVTNNNVPQISLCYKPIIADTLPEVSRQDWNISYDLGKDWQKAVSCKKLNRSLFKVDVVIYPELSLKNMVVTQVYQVLFNLSPTIEVSFWKGMKFTGQLVVPVYNDGFEMLSEAVHNVYDRVHPGVVSLSQTVRLPHNIWASLAVGHFSNNRYGVDMRMQHVLKADERFSVEGRLGYTGPCYWDGFTCHFATNKVWTWEVGANFYWPQYNLQTSLKAMQWTEGEKGVRFDMIRHFRYTSIGFYAVKAKGIDVNGGFRFQVALPPYRYKRKGYIPRVTPSKNMGMAYNAGNERNYYNTFRTEPSDNIMQNNSFNPYYIKSEF